MMMIICRVTRPDENLSLVLLHHQRRIHTIKEDEGNKATRQDGNEVVEPKGEEAGDEIKEPK